MKNRQQIIEKLRQDYYNEVRPIMDKLEDVYNNTAPLYFDKDKAEHVYPEKVAVAIKKYKDQIETIYCKYAKKTKELLK